MDALLSSRSSGPSFWRVADGVLYAEMAMTRTIRPPLLSPWESERVAAFADRDRRSRWLAGRTLAKALVQERLGMDGIIEIREGAAGEPLVYRDGFPLLDVWLGISVRAGRIACVVADRPVSLAVRNTRDGESSVAEHIVSRREQRVVRQTIGDRTASRAVLWTIKEAAVRVARSPFERRGRSTVSLREVDVDHDWRVGVGDRCLDVLAVRVVDGVVVAIVGRRTLTEPHRVRVVLDPAARSAAETGLTSAIERSIERSLARARRLADARARWAHRVQPDG